MLEGRGYCAGGAILVGGVRGKGGVVCTMEGLLRLDYGVWKSKTIDEGRNLIISK